MFYAERKKYFLAVAILFFGFSCLVAQEAKQSPEYLETKHGVGYNKFLRGCSAVVTSGFGLTSIGLFLSESGFWPASALLFTASALATFVFHRDVKRSEKWMEKTSIAEQEKRKPKNLFDLTKKKKKKKRKWFNWKLQSNHFNCE